MEDTSRIELTRGLIALFALGAGLSVSSLYYAQPMLGAIRDDLGSSVAMTSLIASLTQIGYAVGLFFLAPLGDRYDRKSVITMKLVALIGALGLSFLAPGIHTLIFASFFVGVFATAAQEFVPAVATLSPVNERGRNIGTVVTGILLGILLSRVVSGSLSEFLGWRSVFLMGVCLILALLLLTRKLLPKFTPTTDLSYKDLLLSLFVLAKKYPQLRNATFAQALLYAGFSAFWSTLAIILHDRFDLGPMVAGLFGLAGAAGTLAAPIAGRLSDKIGALTIAKLGAAVATLSFALLFLLESIPLPFQIPLMVACAIGFDFGIQGSLVAHQTIIYGLDANSSGRLNALFSTGNFVGMASGALIGGLTYSHFQLLGFSIFVTSVCATALVLKFVTSRNSLKLAAQGVAQKGNSL